jgi:hypothetical protein
VQLIEALSDHLLAVQANRHEISRRIRERPSREALHVAVAHQPFVDRSSGMHSLIERRSVARVFSLLSNTLDSLETNSGLLAWSGQASRELPLIVCK